ncbi:MAG: ATP-grasp domain-containing protein [bacterium]
MFASAKIDAATVINSSGQSDAVVSETFDIKLSRPQQQKSSSKKYRKPRVLFLMPTRTYRANMFLEAAERLDVDAVIGTDQPQTLPSFTAGKILTLNFNNEERAKQAIVEFAAAHPLAAIIATDDDTVVVAALACEALSLPSNPPDAVRATRQKHLMREILQKAGQPTPNFTVCTTDKDPEALSRSVRYPCVIKPVFLSASQGVIRVNNPPKLQQAFARIVDLLKNSELRERGGPAADLILIEDYIPGREFALEGLYSNGILKVLALFDKPDLLEGPYFAETIYVTPSRLSEDQQAQIVQCVDGAAKALGLTHGPIHAEIRLHDAQLFILEIAARSIGGLCSRSLRFEKNMSLEELLLRHALGSHIAAVERESQAAGVMMIPVPQEGILTEIRGLEWAKGVANVEEIKITIPVGQKLIPLPEGNQYLGFIFARHPNPQNVEIALREAFGCLEFVID